MTQVTVKNQIETVEIGGALGSPTAKFELRGNASAYTHIQRHWRRGRFYEAAMLDYIRERYQGGQFLDIGASLGNHSVYFALYCGASEVMAFEPVGVSRDHLHRNLALNSLGGRVLVYDTALGEKCCEGVMSLPEGGNEGMWTFKERAEGGETEMMPLSEFSIDMRHVTLIKIDAEHYEAAIIRGALGIIERFKPGIFVEAQSIGDLFELMSLLQPFGYRVRAQFNATPTYEFTVEDE